MRHTQKKYKDTWVKIIGSLFCSHFIEVMGRTESFFELIFRESYLIALLSGFIIAFILWELVSRMTVWLDARYDWLTNTVQRIFLQLLLAICLPAALLYVLTFLQMKFLFHQEISQVQYLLFEFPAACLLIVLINTYYLIYYFYNKTISAPVAAPLFATEVLSPAVATTEIRNEKQKTDTILVNKGAKTLPIPVESIAFIYKTGEHTYIKTFEGESFFAPFSLDELEARLYENSFFRANRQTIIHRKSCRSFSSIEYGKLELHLQPEHKEQVTHYRYFL
ncbi:MAG TPA: LytTR family DNA-binding domain-containing protein [Chitinophagaceae bacterium]|nr:LytTR family DNA-binding domain-containing protein [Chitinophagaceae bacterium]